MKTVQSFSRKAEHFVISKQNLEGNDKSSSENCLIKTSQETIKGSYSSLNYKSVSFWDGTINTDAETVIQYPANVEGTHFYFLFYKATNQIIFRSNINLSIDEQILNSQSDTGSFLWTSNAELNLMIPANTQATFKLIAVNKEQLLEYLAQDNVSGIKKLLKLTKSNMPFFYFTPKSTINWQEELITFDSLELEKKVEKIINILCKHLNLRRDQYKNQYTPLEFFTVLLVQQQLCEIPATEKPNIASLTNKVSESPKNYLELFQYIFGKTIYEYHRTIHMEFAKWLLETQKLSVSEVGKQLGFKTRNSFAQAFKVHYMSNPKIFKPRSIWTY